MEIIGAISGTSVDGIDVAWVTITDTAITFRKGETVAYAQALRDRLEAAIGGAALSAAAWDQLDYDVALAFSATIADLIPTETPIDLIGSHGQTVWHRPPQGDRLGWSWQLGRGDLIAATTGIPTVSNLRQADISVGGQGAPLVSHLDVWLAGEAVSCWQNLGGIANLTYVAGATILGFDNGPANVLLDAAARRLLGQACDYDGAIAAQGSPNQTLVRQWLTDDLFLQQAPPKSTGREYFNAAYVERCVTAMSDLSVADQLATLTEFTAAAIAQSYRQFLPEMPAQVWLSGGGVRNLTLVRCLTQLLAPIAVSSSAAVNLDPDFKEAIAFAWLAYRRWHNLPSNVPQVTGARRAVSLGDLHRP